MFQIIGIIIGGLILLALLRAALPYAIGLGLIIFLCWLTYAYWQIAIPCWIGLIALGAWYAKKEKEEIAAWKKTQPEPLSEAEIITSIYNSAESTDIIDSNEDEEYKFSQLGEKNTIPYGRVNAFLNFFQQSIHDNLPLYFSAIKSKDRNELREYGTLITDKGIYISRQLDEKDDNSVYKTKDMFIPFAGLKKISGDEKKIEIACISEEADMPVEYKISKDETTLQLSTIKQFFESILSTTLPSVLYHNAIKSVDAALDEDISAEEKLDKKFNEAQNINLGEKATEMGTILGSNVNFNASYNENKNLMDGARGHGYAAEYGNNTMDRLAGREVINAAQNLDENGRQVKYGADRIVDGVHIQTKYYKTAQESVGACFEHKQAKYIGPDGNMMVIEVPSDQYPQALVEMQKRIDSGQVPGAEPHTPAEMYVRKGAFTYNQSFNIAQAGNFDSLKVDITSGIISSTYAGGISAIIMFGIGIWNGQKPKDALKTSLISSARAMGKSVLLYTLTMQLSRSQISNLFAANFVNNNGELVRAGFQSIKNPIAAWSNSLAKSISESALAKTSIGEAMGLRAITGRTLISGTIIGCVVFGPDIVRALRGRISKEQLFKNSAVGGAGLVGAAVGQAIVPIPVAGAMVGAMVSSFFAKKTLDHFVEDDSVKMFQIFKEEFLDIAMLNDISKEEFDFFVNETLLHKEISKILTNMYASGEPRAFARARMETVFSTIMGRRAPISVELIDEGYVELVDEDFIEPARELGYAS